MDRIDAAVNCARERWTFPDGPGWVEIGWVKAGWAKIGWAKIG